MNHALNYIQRNLFNTKVLFMGQKNTQKHNAAIDFSVHASES